MVGPISNNRIRIHDAQGLMGSLDVVGLVEHTVRFILAVYLILFRVVSTTYQQCIGSHYSIVLMILDFASY